MSKAKLTKLELKLNKQLIDATVKACGKKATWSALDVLASASKSQVPLDTGALMASCAVSVSDDGSEGTVSYDTPYAVVQHENQSFNHQRGRKSKYLEDPCNDGGVQSSMISAAQSAFSSKMG